MFNTMRKYIIAIFIFICFLAFSGCEKEVEKNRVLRLEAYYKHIVTYPEYAEYNNPVRNAIIYIDGEIADKSTDYYGRAELRGLPAKLLRIEVEDKYYGKGTFEADLRFTDSLFQSVCLTRQDEEVEILVMSPQRNSIHCSDDTLNFHIKVSSKTLAGKDIAVRIESEKYGRCFSGNPDEAGNIRFNKLLSYGIHDFNMYVSYKTDYEKEKTETFSAEMIRPQALKDFKAIRLGGDSVKVSWKKYERNDFFSYSLYRVLNNSSKLIMTSNDPGVQEFTDTEVQPELNYYYRIETEGRFYEGFHTKYPVHRQSIYISKE